MTFYNTSDMLLPVNMESIKFNADKWCKLTGIFVLDPDGWDRSNFTVSWAEEISFDEFYDRCSASTTGARPRLDYDELKAQTFDKIHLEQIQ